MMNHLRVLLSRRCTLCGCRKPRWTTVCDWCWKHGVGRAYGEEY